jgi:hypothetical protein
MLRRTRALVTIKSYVTAETGQPRLVVGDYHGGLRVWDPESGERL